MPIDNEPNTENDTIASAESTDETEGTTEAEPTGDGEGGDDDGDE